MTSSRWRRRRREASFVDSVCERLRSLASACRGVSWELSRARRRCDVVVVECGDCGVACCSSRVVVAVACAQVSAQSSLRVVAARSSAVSDRWRECCVLTVCRGSNLAIPACAAFFREQHPNPNTVVPKHFTRREKLSVRCWCVVGCLDQRCMCVRVCVCCAAIGFCAAL